MRPEIFYRNLPVSLDNNTCISPTPSPINEKDVEFYFKQITQIMEKDHEYLNPDLNLVNLAKKMNISRNYLSRIINEISGYNFADFINSYRVDKTCQLIATPEFKKQSILELAFEAGFNSKTTFNKAFKKFTGEVPSAYRRRVLLTGTDNKED
jgi:AraC-like DNA-binding protein